MPTGCAVLVNSFSMLRRRTNHDVRILLIAVLALAGGYAALRTFQPLSPGHGWGLALGIVGMIFMVGAQTLYTWRKGRSRRPPGALYYWLRAHIALGLLGGVCVLLHGGGRFAGIAGVAAMLTVVILLSGGIGRYLYTALDRNTEDWQSNHQTLQARVQRLSLSLGSQLGNLTGLLRELDGLATPPAGWRLLMSRAWAPWRAKRRIRARVESEQSCTTAVRLELSELFRAKYDLRLEWESLLALRQLFSWWYAAHVPLSWIMLTLAVIHVLGVWPYWVK
jgi:hypothetical protein